MTEPNKPLHPPRKPPLPVTGLNPGWDQVDELSYHADRLVHCGRRLPERFGRITLGPARAAHSALRPDVADAGL